MLFLSFDRVGDCGHWTVLTYPPHSLQPRLMFGTEDERDRGVTALYESPN